MKKLIITLILGLISIVSVAQTKYAYINSEYILNNIPDYIDAQKKLDDMSEKWQTEIETKKAEINKKYQQYQAEEMLLPAEMKKKKQEEIFALEDNLAKFQYEKFDPEKGELFLKRKELIEPIQNKIFNAVKELASVGNYAFIFDKANQSNILYADPKLDKSKRILKNLGYD